MSPVAVTVTESMIEVRDDGPGIPGDVIEDILDFTVRVSSREAYVGPTRGAQGNALKTIMVMPFVLDGNAGLVEVESLGVHHKIAVRDRPHRPGAQGRDRPRALSWPPPATRPSASICSRSRVAPSTPQSSSPLGHSRPASASSRSQSLCQPMSGKSSASPTAAVTAGSPSSHRLLMR